MTGPYGTREYRSISARYVPGSGTKRRANVCAALLRSDRSLIWRPSYIVDLIELVYGGGGGGAAPGGTRSEREEKEKVGVGLKHKRELTRHCQLTIYHIPQMVQAQALASLSRASTI